MEDLKRRAVTMARARYPGRPEVAAAAAVRIMSCNLPASAIVSMTFGSPAASIAEALAGSEVGKDIALAKFIDGLACELVRGDGTAPAADVQLRMVAYAGQAPQSREDRIRAAAAAIQQPTRNTKGQVSWGHASTRRAFNDAYRSLKDASAKTEDALQLIADQWRCGSGKSLRKRITTAET